eukprot:scaffold4306_cov114-Isochrysis_galbana.AAC.4
MPPCAAYGSSSVRQRGLAAKATVCSGRRPSSSSALIDAPCCSNSSTALYRWCMHAQCSGVSPELSATSTARPPPGAMSGAARRRREDRMLTSPAAAASSSGVLCSSSREITHSGKNCKCCATDRLSCATTASCTDAHSGASRGDATSVGNGVTAAS